jgi:hypothetical protein
MSPLASTPWSKPGPAYCSQEHLKLATWLFFFSARKTSSLPTSDRPCLYASRRAYLPIKCTI